MDKPTFFQYYADGEDGRFPTHREGRIKKRARKGIKARLQGWPEEIKRTTMGRISESVNGRTGRPYFFSCAAALSMPLHNSSVTGTHTPFSHTIL